MAKNPPVVQEIQVWSLGLKDPLEKGMTTHSSILAWRIPWTEAPGGLQSMGLLRVGHNWATSFSCIGEGNGNPLQYSCPENPRDRGAQWAAVYGVYRVGHDWSNLAAAGYSVHRILQARILEWVVIPFSRGSSQAKDWTLVSHIAGRFFTFWATRSSNNNMAWITLTGPSR